jgi:hypothetical protein
MIHSTRRRFLGQTWRLGVVGLYLASRPKVLRAGNRSVRLPRVADIQNLKIVEVGSKPDDPTEIRSDVVIVGGGCGGSI